MVWKLLACACGLALLQTAAEAGDAYVRRSGDTWSFGTGTMERAVSLEGGKLLQRGFNDKASGQELAAGAPTEAFSFLLGDAKEPIDSASGGWELVDAKQTELKQGELQFDLTVKRGALAITKSHVLYPGTSVIREWLVFKNLGGEPIVVADPSFFSLKARVAAADAQDFLWMSGGDNQLNSWKLKREPLATGKPRGFDSYEHFPYEPGTVPPPTGKANDSLWAYRWRPGSASYAPWTALQGRDGQGGLFVGWDYFGHWRSSYTLSADGSVSGKLVVAGFTRKLAPGESFETPKSFVGLFHGDLDEAGNTLLDWQYRYFWDYTREGWFPAIRMAGNWSKGTSWFQPGWTPRGGKPDMDSAFRKVFRLADLMRRCGADVYHRDWGWWDRAGDWNGPDFRATGDYLRKSSMGQLIYASLYCVDPSSEFAKAHPGCLYVDKLNLSKPEVVEQLKRQLDGFQRRWGDFEWRNDAYFTFPMKNDDTPLLGQDQGLREVITSFLDSHPGCAFQSVNCGGTYAGYDYVRYSASFSFSDGKVGARRNYHASLLFPPDKLSDLPDAYNVDKFDKATWRGLLCINFDMTGDTWDAKKLEGLRELINIYHYLQAQGVVGRWVKVHRPTVEGDDPTMYFQRLSGDRKRGVIIPQHPAPGPVTIKPKGLLPGEAYTVSFQESDALQTRPGAELMANGVRIEKMPPGELIYLNLPLHPGSKLDKTAPGAPTRLDKQLGENMGQPGVELQWVPGTDDNWLSHHEILRGGKLIDKVAKGAFYFDHSAGADLAADYEIRAVDGAGNVSAKTKAAGNAAAPSAIVDDGAKDLRWVGSWRHEQGVSPAFEGTLSWAQDKGDGVELTVSGKAVLLFTALGPDGGKAAVSIDGAAPDIVDTYSADSVFGFCSYRKPLPPGPHVLRITVLGEQGQHPSMPVGINGTKVRLDGFRTLQ